MHVKFMNGLSTSESAISAEGYPTTGATEALGKHRVAEQEEHA